MYFPEGYYLRLNHEPVGFTPIITVKHGCNMCCINAAKSNTTKQRQPEVYDALRVWPGTLCFQLFIVLLQVFPWSPAVLQMFPTTVSNRPHYDVCVNMHVLESHFRELHFRFVGAFISKFSIFWAVFPLVKSSLLIRSNILWLLVGNVNAILVTLWMHNQAKCCSDALWLHPYLIIMDWKSSTSKKYTLAEVSINENTHVLGESPLLVQT